jgi:cytoskeletal protein CcmA (bactofilin family)
MWKKEDQPPAPTNTESAPRVEAPRAAPIRRERATIGPSISIRGDVTGDEDLVIEGRVDGSVVLDAHAVTVGGEGRVRASITGRVITVEGHVEGDLTAQEQIVLRGTAQVQGDVKAPRVVLEDGASFRGLVDMGTPPEPRKAGAGRDQAAKSAPGGPADKPEATSGKPAGSAQSTAGSGGTASTATPPSSGLGHASRGKQASGPAGRAGS